VNFKKTIIFSALMCVLLGSGPSGHAQAAAASRPELIYRPRGNFETNIARPLRYWPIGP
jgi:hypothetical protein